MKPGSLLVSQKRPSLRFGVALYRWTSLYFTFREVWTAISEPERRGTRHVCPMAGTFSQDFNREQGWGSWALKYVTISFLEVVYVWENIFLGEMFVHEGDILLRMLWTLRNIKPWLLMACKDTYCLMLSRTQRQNRFQTWIFLCLFPSRAVSYGCSNKIHAACSLIQSSRKREEFLF